MTDTIQLVPLTPNDREQFIRDNQWAFLYGATQESGIRGEHFEEGGEIISHDTIARCIDALDTEAYRIMQGETKAGGLVLQISPEERHGELLLLFVRPELHSKGIGFAAWNAVEAMHPEIDVWETCTPYFEKRNIHFYVNRCGFHIVEFFCAAHPDPLCDPDEPVEGPDEMFRFEKIIR